MRNFIVAANWKMNKGPRETAQFFKEFLPALGELGLGQNQDQKQNQRREVVFFVPAINLTATAEALRGSTVKWGAQNCYFEIKGAFTGENSPAVLAEIGAPYALVGHSERRALFHETDADTGKKVRALQAAGLVPMLCVGETLAEREAGKTTEVILRQLHGGLSLRDSLHPVVIAYEPVWAIGTGKVATAAQANEAHLALRRGLNEIGGASLADTTAILYGGSVKPDNCGEIAREAEVDGFLVGGASLEIASFLPLCQVKKV